MADDGRADPRLAAALLAHDGSSATRAEVLAALATARVFVPVRAVSTREELSATTGLRQESSAEMQLVLLRSSSGATALPAFPDGHDVQAWQPEARPVPLPGPQACRSALDQGAGTLLLDPTGARLPVTGEELAALAQGRVPVPGTGLSARTAATALTAPARPDPGLARALAAALQDEPVRAARLLDGPDGPVVGVVPRAPLDPAALAALASRVVARLGADLPAAGLDLTVVAEDGPGTDLLRTRRRLRRDR